MRLVVLAAFQIVPVINYRSCRVLPEAMLQLYQNPRHHKRCDDSGLLVTVLEKVIRLRCPLDQLALLELIEMVADLARALGRVTRIKST
jgi:hypothetical protein